MHINNIFNRVATWNEARYPQIYNKQLTIDLLREEHTEYNEAQSPVDKLDALCDVIYVACGALWKLKVGILSMGCLARTHYWIDSMENGDDRMMLHGIIATALCDMNALGLSEVQNMKALDIVCDSNDSKSAKMTAPGIKANIDKGAAFQAPEPRLQKVLDGEELWSI